MIRATTFAGKTVAVFGLGSSGNATARALIEGGATVAAWDDGEAGRASAQKAGVPLVDLNTSDWSGFAALVLAPGVPLTHPEPHWTVQKARAAGVEVIGDVELFFRERAAVMHDAVVVAITGTNGKSTTTALAAHILTCAGRDVQMGGNIGVPVLALEPFAPGRIYVLELSSFQIDLTPSLSPTVGVLLNITPDHLDRHGPKDDPDAAMRNYAAIKERLIKDANYSIVGVDDVHSSIIFIRRTAAWVEALLRTGRHNLRSAEVIVQRQVIAISAHAKLEPGMFADGQRLVCATKRLASRGQNSFYYTTDLLVDVGGIGTLRGAHNSQNALAACGAFSFVSEIVKQKAWSELMSKLDSDPELAGLRGNAAEFFQVPRNRELKNEKFLDAHAEFLSKQIHLPKEGLRAWLATYPGLPHRMEQVGTLEKPDGRILFINDSKATNADSTEKALASWDKDIFVVLGGKPKEGGITSLASYFPRIAKAYLIGQATEEFAATLEGNVPFERCGTLDKALAAATRDALASPGAEPVVLLSPACASYDQFRSFEHRGNEFRRMVQAMRGVVAGGVS